MKKIICACLVVLAMCGLSTITYAGSADTKPQTSKHQKKHHKKVAKSNKHAKKATKKAQQQ